jgi:hypothetical protein
MELTNFNVEKSKEIRESNKKNRLPKCGIIWGADKTNPVNHYPLAYITKPKWMDEQHYQIVLDSIKIALPSEIKLDNIK